MLDFYEWGLIGLFFACFLASTLLPLSSEALVLAFLLSGNFSISIVIFVATIGNSLGSSLNYYLGFIGQKYFLKNKEKNVQTYQKYIQKYGSFTAFFSWIPFVGDPLMVVLGYLKTPVFYSISWMIVGKFLRYLFLVLFV